MVLLLYDKNAAAIFAMSKERRGIFEFMGIS